MKNIFFDMDHCLKYMKGGVLEHCRENVKYRSVEVFHQAGIAFINKNRFIIAYYERTSPFRPIVEIHGITKTEMTRRA